MESTFNMFDFAVLIIIGLSALLSFFRGFVREVLSLGTWVVASIVTLRFMPTVSDLIKPQVKSEVIANGIASIGLFFVTLVLISIITGLLVKVLKIGDKVGLFDNLGGLIFGIARGALIVSIAYFAMTIIMAEKDYPELIKKAVSRPYIEKCVHWLATLAPEYLDKITSKETGDGDLGKESRKQVNELIRTLDKTRDGAIRKMDATVDDAQEKASSLPSMEDLQQRIREENGRR